MHANTVQKDCSIIFYVFKALHASQLAYGAQVSMQLPIHKLMSL